MSSANCQPFSCLNDNVLKLTEYGQINLSDFEWDTIICSKKIIFEYNNHVLYHTGHSITCKFMYHNCIWINLPCQYVLCLIPDYFSLSTCSGYIDLSKRRVSPEEIGKCEDKFAKAKCVSKEIIYIISTVSLHKSGYMVWFAVQFAPSHRLNRWWLISEAEPSWKIWMRFQYMYGHQGIWYKIQLRSLF